MIDRKERDGDAMSWNGTKYGIMLIMVLYCGLWFRDYHICFRVVSLYVHVVFVLYN